MGEHPSPVQRLQLVRALPTISLPASVNATPKAKGRHSNTTAGSAHSMRTSHCSLQPRRRAMCSADLVSSSTRPAPNVQQVRSVSGEAYCSIGAQHGPVTPVRFLANLVPSVSRLGQMPRRIALAGRFGQVTPLALSCSHPHGNQVTVFTVEQTSAIVSGPFCSWTSHWCDQVYIMPRLSK